MRRIALTIVSTIAGLVILLTLKANTAQTPAAASTPPAVVAAAPSSAAPATTTGSSKATAAAPAAKTVAGTAVKNQYESFQVQLTVAGGKISKIEILNLVTPDPTSKQIAGGALPKLQQATLTANSANVDTVSGATFTSKSYKESLQAALDKAGL